MLGIFTLGKGFKMKEKLLMPIIILGFILFHGCEQATSVPDLPETNPPVINSFTANPSEISVGESSTLSWNVTNATNVQIDQGIGTVSSQGTKAVSPTQTSTYRLTASNNVANVTQSCTVTVKNPL